MRIKELRQVARDIARGMSAHFGQAFRNQWPTADEWKDAMGLWATECYPYRANLGKAFDAIRRQDHSWPPNLANFLSMLREQARPEQQVYKSLPKPAGDKQLAAMAIATMALRLR